jgi:hypothetical protein
MLSGLGVPDIRGTIGRPSFYTSDPSASLGDNEFSLELVRLPARSGILETKIIGPYNKPFYGYVIERRLEGIKDPAERSRVRRETEEGLKKRKIPRVIEIPMRLETTADALKISFEGRELALKPGEWSDWVVFDFPVNWLVDRIAPIRGIGRFQLFSLSPGSSSGCHRSTSTRVPRCRTFPDHYAQGCTTDRVLRRSAGRRTLVAPSGVGDGSTSSTT